MVALFRLFFVCFFLYLMCKAQWSRRKTTCELGYFSSEGSSDCTEKCQSGCRSCKNKYTCLSCKDGFYKVNAKDTCTGRCHSNCRSCRVANICLACQSGYYNVSRNCSQRCIANCERCTSTTFCSTCKPGFKRTFHRPTCPSISKCPKLWKCVKCPRNMYGYDCQQRCSDGCSGWCDGTSGQCNVCRMGYYGTFCDQTCKTTCNMGMCHKNGTCKYVSRSKVIECPESCFLKFNQRDASTACPDGCKNKCPVGRYGINCDKYCPSGCKDSVCSYQTGYCLKGCQVGFNITTNCRDCVMGRYGSLCLENCSSNCMLDSCHRLNGTCTYGCKQSQFFGPKCEAAINLKTKSSCQEQCTKCSKSYTINCSHLCKMCPPLLNKTTSGCPKGKFGATCELNCSVNCKDQICHKENGTCVKGCVNNELKDSTCQGCETGRYGEACCASSNYTGQWCEHCKLGLYGEFCEHKCLNCCGNLTCDRWTGDCIQNCLDFTLGRTSGVLETTTSTMSDDAALCCNTIHVMLICICGILLGTVILLVTGHILRDIRVNSPKQRSSNKRRQPQQVHDDSNRYSRKVPKHHTDNAAADDNDIDDDTTEPYMVHDICLEEPVHYDQPDDPQKPIQYVYPLHLLPVQSPRASET